MVVKKDSVRRFLWRTAVAITVVHAFWQMVALFYGILPFEFSKFFLMIAALCGFFIFLIQRTNGFITKKEVLVVALVFTMLISVAAQMLLFPDVLSRGHYSAQKYLVVVTVFNIFWLLSGYAFRSVNGATNKQFLSFMIVSVVAFLIIVNLNGAVIIDYRKFDANVGLNTAANHLVIGESVYLILIACYAFSFAKYRIIIFLMSAPLLLSLGGRAELSLYVIAVVTYEWLSGRKRSTTIQLLMLLGFCAGIILTLPASFLEATGISRMLFTQGISGDSSFVARESLLMSGIRDLPEQALVGNISYLVSVHGSTGSYVHNLLSVWQYYGFIAFALVVFFFLSNLKYVRLTARYTSNPLDRFGILLFISALVGVLVAKALTYPILWLAIGYYSSSAISRDTDISRFLSTAR